jgi:hypothetical protein
MTDFPEAQYLQFLASPALTDQSDIYPARFEGRVPKLIRPTRFVRSDLPAIIVGSDVSVTPHGVYYATTNRNGAVCAVRSASRGDALGLKPDEYEVVEWAAPEDLIAAKLLAERNKLRKLWRMLMQELGRED